MPIDDSKFLEPTQAYLNRLGYVKGRPKLWFNLDLIYIAYRYKDAKPDDKLECKRKYMLWLGEMNVEYSFDEIYERFKSYPQKDFNKLLNVLMKKTLK